MTYPEGVDVGYPQTSDFGWAEFYIVRLGSTRQDDVRRIQHTLFARTNKIPLGSYWFMYAEGSPEADADHAFQIMTDLSLVDQPFFADAEGACTVDYATRFIARMKTHRPECGLYSGYWIKSHGGSTLGADYGWLPQYQETYQRPSGWSESFLKLWQWTSSSGVLDRDRFLGTFDDMLTFFGGDMAAVDELLDGMQAAETASQSGTVDPGVPPDTLSNYGKRGWNRVRWMLRNVAIPDDGAIGNLEADVATHEQRLGEVEVDTSALTARVVALEDEPPAQTHTHTDVTVAGPAT